MVTMQGKMDNVSINKERTQARDAHSSFGGVPLLLACSHLLWKLAPTLFGLFRGVWFARKMATVCALRQGLARGSSRGRAAPHAAGGEEKKKRYGERDGTECPRKKVSPSAMVGRMITPPFLIQLWRRGEGVYGKWIGSKTHIPGLFVSEKRSIVGSNHGNTVGTAAILWPRRTPSTVTSILGPQSSESRRSVSTSP